MSLVYVILALVLATILCIVEIPSILKNKELIDFWAFVLLLALGFTVTILRVFNVTVPSPIILLSYLYSPVSDFFAEFLKSAER